MSEPVVLQDLSPYEAADAGEDRWLAAVADHLAETDHVLRLTEGGREDDEDEPALYRGTDGKWWTGRFIGEVRFGERELRIEPRLDIDVIGAWLAYALNLNVIPRAGTPDAKGPLIARLVDRMWSAAIADAARHGGPRLRRTIQHNGIYVRGRLDVAGTLRHRLAGRPLLASTRAARDLDNPVARAIVLADRTLRSVLAAPPDWRPPLAEDLLGQLRGAVGSVPRLPSVEELRQVRYSPITRRFESVAQLSFEIARRRGTLTSASSDDAGGVLIDVAELWELFLVHCARRAFGRARTEHGTSSREATHLLASLSDPSRRIGRLKPDILIESSAGELAAVIDAKYKRLRNRRDARHGVERGDLYQLAAYMSGHQVPLGMLAYPPSADDHATAEAFGPWSVRGGQELRFVRLPAHEAECIDALRGLIEPARIRVTERALAIV